MQKEPFWVVEGREERKARLEKDRRETMGKLLCLGAKDEEDEEPRVRMMGVL